MRWIVLTSGSRSCCTRRVAASISPPAGLRPLLDAVGDDPEQERLGGAIPVLEQCHLDAPTRQEVAEGRAPHHGARGGCGLSLPGWLPVREPR